MAADESLKDWDPMRDAFNDKTFNNYNKGLGRDINLQSGSDRENQLYVTGIPAGLTDKGLANLFSRAGKVLRTFISKKRTDSKPYFYGFVTMSSRDEMERAIRQLDNFKIHEEYQALRVTVSLNKQQLDRRKQGDTGTGGGDSGGDDRQYVNRLVSGIETESDYDEAMDLQMQQQLSGDERAGDRRLAVGRGDTRDHRPQVQRETPADMAYRQPQHRSDNSAGYQAGSRGGVDYNRDQQRPLGATPSGYQSDSSQQLQRSVARLNQDQQPSLRSQDHSSSSNSGPVNRGPPNSGPVNRGPPDSGPVNHGPSSSGPVNRGPPDSRPVNRGPSNSGPVNRGPPDSGPVNRGPSNSGPVNRGPSNSSGLLKGGVSSGYNSSTSPNLPTNTEAPDIVARAPVKTAVVTPVRTCNFCRKSGKMLHCQVCQTPYCSGECQKNDWQDHKFECKTIAAQAKKQREQQEMFKAVAANYGLTEDGDELHYSDEDDLDLTMNPDREHAEQGMLPAMCLSHTWEELTMGDSEAVQLSSYKNPTQFWLTRMKRMDDLIASMQRTYNGTPDSEGNSVQVNDLCAVKTPADGRWCRGVVVKVTASDSVEVLLADSGHWVTVARANLRPLLAQHGTKPLQAMWCKLDVEPVTLPWTRQALNVAGQVLQERRMYWAERIDRSEQGQTTVKLTLSEDNNRDMTAYLLQHNICRLPQPPTPPQPAMVVAAPTSASREPAAAAAASHSPVDAVSTTTAAYVHDPVVPLLPPSVARVNMPVPSVHDACIIHADSPSQLWFVLKTPEVVDEATGLLPKLSNNMTLCYSQLQPASHTAQLDPNVLYAAKFIDDLWYRAQIISQDAGGVNVVYVDYGNRSRVPLTDIHPLLTAHLEALPVQGIRARIGQVTSGVGRTTWPRDAVAAVQQICDQPVNVRVINVSPDDGIAEIDIIVDKVGSLSSFLLDNGWAVQQVILANNEIADVGFTGRAYIVLANDDGTLYVQIVSEAAIKAVSSIEAKLASLYTTYRGSYRPKVGELVAAKFFEDKLWYRARVTEVQASQVAVTLIDYGNQLVVKFEDIACIKDDELKSYPPMCVRMSIVGGKASPVNAYTVSMTIDFKIVRVEKGPHLFVRDTAVLESEMESLLPPKPVASPAPPALVSASPAPAAVVTPSTAPATVVSSSPIAYARPPKRDETAKPAASVSNSAPVSGLVSQTSGSLSQTSGSVSQTSLQSSPVKGQKLSSGEQPQSSTPELNKKLKEFLISSSSDADKTEVANQPAATVTPHHTQSGVSTKSADNFAARVAALNMDHSRASGFPLGSLNLRKTITGASPPAVPSTPVAQGQGQVHDFSYSSLENRQVSTSTAAAAAADQMKSSVVPTSGNMKFSHDQPPEGRTRGRGAGNHAGRGQQRGSYQQDSHRATPAPSQPSPSDQGHSPVSRSDGLCYELPSVEIDFGEIFFVSSVRGCHMTVTSQSKLVELSARIKRHYEAQQLNYVPHFKEIVCVYSQNEGHWLRGKAIEYRPGQYLKVVLCDLGYEEVLPADAPICCMSPELAETPILSLDCELVVDESLAAVAAAQLGNLIHLENVCIEVRGWKTNNVALLRDLQHTTKGSIVKMLRSLAE